MLVVVQSVNKYDEGDNFCVVCLITDKLCSTYKFIHVNVAQIF